MYGEDFWPNGLPKSEYDFFGNPIVKQKKSTELKAQYAFKEFWLAIEQRISNPKRSITDDGRDYKNYYNLKESLKKSVNGENGMPDYYTSKLGGYFKQLQEDNPSLLYLRTEDYLNNYIYMLDDWIEKYGINRHDVIYFDPNKNNTIIHSNTDNIIDLPNDVQLSGEILNDDIIIKKGRPLGSKNKKTNKLEIYFPEHIIPLQNNGNLNEEALILAIADLVWRQNNQKDMFYISKLKLNPNQLKYVNALFINKSKKLNNPYWKINEVNGEKKLIALRKRAGFYFVNSNKEYKFYSSTKLAQLLKMNRQTLEYKLKFKSLAQVKQENLNKFS